MFCMVNATICINAYAEFIPDTYALDLSRRKKYETTKVNSIVNYPNG